jgi:uncharacterized protein
MSLKDRIKEETQQAMRARDSARINALRMLQAGIQRREVDERTALDDSQVLAVIDKLVKQSREAIEQYEKGGRADLVEKERADVAVWQTYLPKAFTEAEVDALIEQTIHATGASSAKDMGKVMAQLKPKLQGRADLGQVSRKVKARLGG